MSLFDLDEKQSAGKVLVIKSPFLPKAPTPVDHYVPPETPPSDQHQTDRAQARAIADQMLSLIPPKLVAQAAAAYQASQAASRALNAAQSELAALNDPAPAGLDVDALAARRLRKLGMADHLDDLRRAQQQADRACNEALAAAREAAELGAGRVVFDQERARIREMREEADRLTFAAEHYEISLRNALGLVNAWLPTDPAAPIVEPPAKRRIFQKGN